ncbi:MAG TPA: hypothetical protein VK957_03085 [Lunatimonas sp.]|nr:hypothetical protein [Lunatimonas sp.]
MEHLKLEPKDEFFEPCENEVIIKRTIRNLIYAFDKIGELEKMREVQELMDILDR